MADSPAQKVANLSAEVGVIRAELAARTDRITRLERDLEAAEADIVTLRERITAVETSASGLKANSDRGWSLTQAFIVLAVTSLISISVQFAFRK